MKKQNIISSNDHGSYVHERMEFQSFPGCGILNYQDYISKQDKYP